MRKLHFTPICLLLYTCFRPWNLSLLLNAAAPADVSRVCVQLLIWNICMGGWFPPGSAAERSIFLSLLYFIVIYRSKFKRAGMRVWHPDALTQPHEKLLVSVQLQLLASPHPASLISVPLPHSMINNNQLLHSLAIYFMSRSHRKTYTHSYVRIHTETCNLSVNFWGKKIDLSALKICAGCGLQPHWLLKSQRL